MVFLFSKCITQVHRDHARRHEEVHQWWQQWHRLLSAALRADQHHALELRDVSEGQGFTEHGWGVLQERNLNILHNLAICS